MIPANIHADGTSTASIVATLVDSLGQPVTAAADVTLTLSTSNPASCPLETATTVIPAGSSDSAGSPGLVRSTTTAGGATISGVASGGFTGPVTATTLTTTQTSGLPPDPATFAPPVDPSVATDIASSTAFLYSGANPIQTGVTPGTIDPRRAAVLRGKVLARDGLPLPGVTIKILGHPELEVR